jgi:hypothetical protein
MLYSVKAPAGVILPTALLVFSVNQRLPSGPAVIPAGPLLGVGMANSVTVPTGALLLAVRVWPAAPRKTTPLNVCTPWSAAVKV